MKKRRVLELFVVYSILTSSIIARDQSNEAAIFPPNEAYEAIDRGDAAGLSAHLTPETVNGKSPHQLNQSVLDYLLLQKRAETRAMVRAIKERGGDLEALNPVGDLPVAYAVLDGNTDAVEALAHHGARVDIRTTIGGKNCSMYGHVTGMLRRSPAVAVALDCARIKEILERHGARRASQLRRRRRRRAKRRRVDERNERL